MDEHKYIPDKEVNVKNGILKELGEKLGVVNDNNENVNNH